MMIDILGNELKHGDEVITVAKNERAVGGDLAIATVVIENGKFSLKSNRYGLYKRFTPSKLCRIRTAEQVEMDSYQGAQ